MYKRQQEEPASLALGEVQPYEAAHEVTQEVEISPVEDSPAVAAVEFEPEEASASYRVDPSAPSEFRFAAPSSTTVEEELAPEAEEYPSIAEFELAAEMRPLHGQPEDCLLYTSRCV